MVDPDPLKDLRAAWRSLDAPEPSDERAELAERDPEGAEVVDWLRAAWVSLEVPATPPVPHIPTARPTALPTFLRAAAVVFVAASLALGAWKLFAADDAHERELVAPRVEPEAPPPGAPEPAPPSADEPVRLAALEGRVHFFLKVGGKRGRAVGGRRLAGHWGLNRHHRGHRFCGCVGFRNGGGTRERHRTTHGFAGVLGIGTEIGKWLQGRL